MATHTYGYYHGYVNGYYANEIFGDVYGQPDSLITIVTTAPIYVPEGKWYLQRLMTTTGETVLWRIEQDNKAVSSIPRDVLIQVIRGHVDVQMQQPA